MDSTGFFTLELASAVILVGLLIAAVIQLIRHYRTPMNERTPAQNLLILVIAGLAMLDFLMINLLGADILDPDRTLTVNALITILAINLPLGMGIAWLFFRNASGRKL